jgi:SNF2 family DNA or RNA helicase
MTSYPMVEQPKNYSIKLFPHQLTAIYNMEEKEKQQVVKLHNNITIKLNMGIYSDITGYGKTLSVIGLIIRDKMRWDCNDDYERVEQCCYIGDGIISGERVFKYKKINSTLIVVNHSIINQWLEELKKSSLKILSIQKVKDITNFKINEHDVIVILSTMYNKLMVEYNNYIWKRFIFDEPTHTYIPAMKKFNAGFSWFISATPNMFLTRRCWGNGYLSTVFSNYYFTYDILQMLIIKNNEQYVKSSYKLPKTNDIYHICYQPMFHMVREYIDEETSRMIEAGDISSAISRLGGDSTSNIIDVIKERKIEQIDQLKLRIQYHIRRNNISRVTKITEQKNKLEKEIEKLEEKFKDRLSDNCSVCMEGLNKPVLVPCCQNIFCGKCVLEWLKNNTTCPLCRVSIDTQDLIYIEKDNIDNVKSKIDKQLSKSETIIDIVKNNKEGKFIIFSEFDETFFSIRDVLTDNNITFKELKGHSSTRKKNIRLFKEGKVQVLFLNSNYNGAGINLQESTDIILYHDMNEDMKKQIIGRANRIGRENILNIHHLI